MARQTTTLSLPSEDETNLLGRTLARYAKAGDTILLRGQIGAGKSALARAFIRDMAGAEIEVPSPTFTLVQTYELAEVEVWHADLYRLSDPQEVIELGLVDAMHDQICLIEWPELLGDLVPSNGLEILLESDGDGRLATFTFGQDWVDRIARLTNAE